MTRCVYCRTRPIEPAWNPFCSDRCRLLDLQRWLDEDYRVAADEAVPDEDPEATE